MVARSVAWRGSTSRGEVETRREALEERFGSEEPRAGGSELDGQGEPVEAFTERLDRRRALDVRTHGTGTREEQLDSFLCGKRGEIEPALGGNLEGLSARDEQSQRRRRVGECGE